MLSQSSEIATTWWGSVSIMLLLACGYFYWTYQLVTLLRVARRVPSLEGLREEPRGLWPRVSVVMTARNEEAELEAAMQARLADDYPNLELVLVEDRSTDGTAEIAARLATSDARMKLLHITELPQGWLGKLNAMQHGYRATTGEWLLFSDADVTVAPGVLRRVVAHCERHDIDHCVVLPTCRSVNFLLAAVVAVFVRALRAIERAAYTTIGNFSAVRLTVIGVALALLELSPLLALGVSSSRLAVAASVGLLLVAAASMMLANGWLKRPVSELLLAPIAAMFWAYACVRSGVLGRRRRGVYWRGTFYGDAELRAGRRLRI